MSELSSRAMTRLSLVVLMAGALMALAARQVVVANEWHVAFAGTPNIFFWLYAFDALPAAMLLLVTTAVLFVATRSAHSETAASVWTADIPAARKYVVGVALAVIGITSLGTFLICHDYPFSMDEFGAVFQAQGFLAGTVKPAISAEWMPFAAALDPIFVHLDLANGAWVSEYLPVHAAFRALFMAVESGWLLNPLAAGVTLVALARIVQNVWPDTRDEGLIAAIFLASSPQFLVTSMTAYAMPMHLCLNTLWLACYTSRSVRNQRVTPWIGLLALGLHNYVVHAVFVLPFLLRIVIERNWRRAFYFAAVYLAACAIWLGWRQLLLPANRSIHADPFGLPHGIMLFNQSIDLAMLFLWHSAALVFLLPWALRRFRALPPVVRDCAYACAITFAVHACYRSTYNQGHGFGYRYFYGVLGCFVILGVAGFRVAREVAPRLARNVVLVGTLSALVFQVPMRCFEVEQLIAPFARASRYIDGLNADVVLITPMVSWYAQDFVRNDPLLRNRPKRMFLTRLDQSLADGLRGQRVHILRPSELRPFDMIGLGSDDELPPRRTARDHAGVAQPTRVPGSAER